MFDSKAISLCKLVGSQTLFSTPFLNTSHSASLKGSQHFSSSTGVSPKTSYSLTTSNKAISSIGKENFSLETFPYEINGTTNGASSSLFLTEMRELEAFDDEYGGVIVNSDRLPINQKLFASRLRLSLSHWKTLGKKGVWLKLPLERAELVPIAVKVLVVQEKHCAPALAGLWKIPTGFILESEEIFTGAVREVKEETGVDTEFVEVIAFRHAHNVAFEKSDLFFICMLRPLSTQIIVDNLEIQTAKWMPLVEFVEQPLMQEDSMFKKVIDICIAHLGKRYCGLCAHQLVSKFDSRLSSLYYNVVQDEDFNCQSG